MYMRSARRIWSSAAVLGHSMAKGVMRAESRTYICRYIETPVRFVVVVVAGRRRRLSMKTHGGLCVCASLALYFHAASIIAPNASERIRRHPYTKTHTHISYKSSGIHARGIIISSTQYDDGDGSILNIRRISRALFGFLYTIVIMVSFF